MVIEPPIKPVGVRHKVSWLAIFLEHADNVLQPVCSNCTTEEKRRACKPSWSLLFSKVTIRCYQCCLLKVKCLFADADWGIAFWPVVTKSMGEQARRDANNLKKTAPQPLTAPVIGKSNLDGSVVTRRSSRSAKQLAKNPRKTQNKESLAISRSVLEGQADEETVEEVHKEAAPIQTPLPLSQLPGLLQLGLGDPPLRQVDQIFFEDLNLLQGLWKQMRHPDVSQTDLQAGLSHEQFLSRSAATSTCCFSRPKVDSRSLTR